MSPVTHDRLPVMNQVLNAVARARRRAYLIFAAGWLATFAALVWFAYVLRTSADIKDASAAAVIALVFAICMSSFVVTIAVTRMTQTVLRAIHITTPR